MLMKSLAAAAIAAPLAGCGGLGSGPVTASGPVGIQLYTLRTAIESQGVRPVIEALAAMGYRELELFSLHGQPLNVWEDMLADTGLSAPSTHCALADFENEWQALVERAERLHHDYLTIAYLTEEQRGTIDQYKKHAAAFNRYGELCKSIGASFAYHNHDFEFMPIDGIVPYQILLDETDPELVKFEMDIYWVRKANRNPLELIAQSPGRFHMAHVKDMASGETGAMTDVGDGIIDFAAIFAASDQAGLRHIFVERDDATDPLKTARTSIGHLSGLDLSKIGT
jgi:sugar phosphate isomerase/epimerase